MPSNLATFWHNMRLIGADKEKIEAVSGAFQQTLRNTPDHFGIDSISICHIDTNIHEATYLALKFAGPVLQDGALVLFDSYHQFAANNSRGERSAVRRWLDEYPNYSLELYRNYGVFGACFIFHNTL